MKRQVRIGVFETNSSMTHALTMCSDSEYQKWRKGELYWSKWSWGDDRDFIPVEEADAECRPAYDSDDNHDDYYENYEDYIEREYGYVSYDRFGYDEYLESFEQTYTTPNGEIVHAFGLYGHD